MKISRKRLFRIIDISQQLFVFIFIYSYISFVNLPPPKKNKGKNIEYLQFYYNRKHSAVYSFLKILDINLIELSVDFFD